MSQLVQAHVQTLSRFRFPLFSLFFTLISSLLFFGPGHLQAAPLIITHPLSYYGSDFYDLVQQQNNETYSSSELLQLLNKILNSSHQTIEGEYDKIMDHCEPSQNHHPEPAKCYTQKMHSYSEARRIILSQLHLSYEEDKGYFIRDVYCQRDLTQQDFPWEEGPSPKNVPNANIVNIEHTWPQNYFTNRRSMQKADLHHLFPTQNKINSLRGHLPFGEVKFFVKKDFCSGASTGYIESKSKEKYFEPPANHRGNVARALFYFSVKYGTPISDEQEFFLRKWNKQDPVDGFESERNDKIWALQKTRNPFIDYPDLAEKILNF